MPKLNRSSVHWLSILAVGLIAGCTPAGPAETLQATTAPAAPPSPTPLDSTSTPTVPVPSPTTTRTAPPPTATAQPSPSDTPVPHAEVEVTLLDCQTTFCPPEDLEHLANVGSRQPGILAVEILGELTARLIYDPTQLSEAEAVEAFANAGRIEVEVVP